MSISRRRFLGLGAALSLGGAARAAAPGDYAEFELDRFFIAGFRFHEGPAVIRNMRLGDRVALRPEPDNPHDPGAVRLEFAGRHVGYVPRSQNAVVGRLLGQRAALSGRIVGVDPAAEPWEAVEVAVSIAGVAPSGT